jgi:hypothetical protein
MNAEPTPPTIAERLADMEAARSVFFERRDRYLDLTAQAKTHQAEGEALEAEAADFDLNIKASFQDESITVETRRDMALRRTSAASLAAHYREHAERLNGEASRAEMEAKVAAGAYAEAWGLAAEAYIDADFAADMARIEEELMAIVRRRAGLYVRVPHAMGTKRIGYAEGLRITRHVFCALKDVTAHLTARFRDQGMAFVHEWTAGPSLGNRPDLSPFARSEIGNGLNRVEWRRQLSESA